MIYLRSAPNRTLSLFALDREALSGSYKNGEFLHAHPEANIRLTARKRAARYRLVGKHIRPTFH
jgi:hypothetical protein